MTAVALLLVVLAALGIGAAAPPVTVFMAPQWGLRPSGPA